MGVGKKKKIEKSFNDLSIHNMYYVEIHRNLKTATTNFKVSHLCIYVYIVYQLSNDAMNQYNWLLPLELNCLFIQGSNDKLGRLKNENRMGQIHRYT